MFERLPGSNTSLRGYSHQWEAYVGHDDIFHGNQLYEEAFHDLPEYDNNTSTWNQAIWSHVRSNRAGHLERCLQGVDGGGRGGSMYFVSALDFSFKMYNKSSNIAKNIYTSVIICPGLIVSSPFVVGAT